MFGEKESDTERKKKERKKDGERERKVSRPRGNVRQEMPNTDKQKWETWVKCCPWKMPPQTFCSKIYMSKYLAF